MDAGAVGPGAPGRLMSAASACAVPPVPAAAGGVLPSGRRCSIIFHHAGLAWPRQTVALVLFNRGGDGAGGGVPAALFGYDVVTRLGEGAASVIYAAKSRRDGVWYALKHLVVRSAYDGRYVEQLEQELAVSRRLGHPALRRCYELKKRRNVFLRVTEAALVMELVEGVPLDQQRPQPLRVVMGYFRQAAEALGALHYLRYVHCDVKPNNILVCPDGRIKLIDFGHACRSGTVKRRIQGTPDFIAPEQVTRGAVTVRTDVFSFGATLYWALSGQRIATLYTVGRSQREVVAECRFPSPRQINEAVPQALSDLVMDCVRLEPARRPADMDEVIRRMEQAVPNVSGGL